VRESIGETRGSLDGWECELSHVIGVVEAEDTLDLVVVDVLLHFKHVRVQVLDVIDV